MATKTMLAIAGKTNVEARFGGFPCKRKFTTTTIFKHYAEIMNGKLFAISRNYSTAERCYAELRDDVLYANGMCSSYGIQNDVIIVK